MSGLRPVPDDGDRAEAEVLDGPVGQGVTDWRHDPRELTDSIERRASRRRRSRIGAVVAAVLLVVGGGYYLGFVTGWVSIPGLGTLTAHPADVSTFTVGKTTYAMQVDGNDGETVVVSQLVGNAGQHLGTLPVPGPGTISVTVLPPLQDGSDPARTTYAAVLPPNAHDVMPRPNDVQMSVTSREGVVRTSRSGSTLLGAIMTVDPPSGAPQSLGQPGLASIGWTDGDGRHHVTPVGR